MSQKFIYITDVHFGATPVSRKAGYNEQILAKVEWILKLAKKNKCVVLNGGDFFDKPKVAVFNLIQVLKLFRQYSDVEFYSIRGNPGHDSFEESSPLTIMEMCGFFKLTDTHKDFGDVRVIFKDHGVEDAEDHVDASKINIMMTHETIVKDPIIFEHTLIDNFKTKAQLVTVAHYHPYQGIMVNSNGTKFVAPGAIARRKKVSHDIDREIKCVYINVNDQKEILCKEIIVPSVKDVWTEKTVLDIDDESCYNEMSEEVKKMKNLLLEEMKFSSIEEMLKTYATGMNTEEAVLNFTLGELSKI